MIGVLPPGFHFLADADVVIPLRPNMPVIYAERSVDAIAVLARLKSGVAAGEAGAEMNAIQRRPRPPVSGCQPQRRRRCNLADAADHR